MADNKDPIDEKLSAMFWKGRNTNASPQILDPTVENKDLTDLFWKGRGMNDELPAIKKSPDVCQNSVEYEKSIQAYLNNPGLAEIRQLTDLHVDKELKLQKLEDLNDYRQQQMFGLVYDGSESKVVMEKCHLSNVNKINEFVHNNEIERYYEDKRKAEYIRKISGGDVKPPVKPELVNEEPEIYEGMSIQRYMSQKKQKFMRSLSLAELESMIENSECPTDFNIRRDDVYTGTELIEIIKKFIVEKQNEEKKRNIAREIRKDVLERQPVSVGCAAVTNWFTSLLPSWLTGGQTPETAKQPDYSKMSKDEIVKDLKTIDIDKVTLEINEAKKQIETSSDRFSGFREDIPELRNKQMAAVRCERSEDFDKTHCRRRDIAEIKKQ